MGGMGAAIGSGLSTAGNAVATGAKSLYGDAKNFVQTGQPNNAGEDPTLAQRLLFGDGQQQGPTAAQRNRQMQASM